MHRVMVDLETLSSRADAVIMQIGIQPFLVTPDGVIVEHSAGMLINVNTENSQLAGGRICADTVHWWLKQSKEARESLNSSFPLLEPDALKMATEYFENTDEIWSNATFDACVLGEAYARSGYGVTFPFKKARDIRTLISLSKPKDVEESFKILRTGTHHNALDDARHQAQYTGYLLSRLGK